MCQCYRDEADRRDGLPDRSLSNSIAAESKRAITDAAIFDFGIQDTGRDGASWALANRGVPVRSAAQLEADPDIALAWTLRGAPHYYRRSELPDVLVATSPFSDKDAGKRIIGADKPLQEAGIAARDGLAEVASQMRRIVTKPMVKGEVSTRLTAALERALPALLRALPGRPSVGTAVPARRAVRRTGARAGDLAAGAAAHPGWPRRKAGPADDPLAAPEHLQPIRNYLRFLGPATPNDVAAFLDAPVAEIKAHWPEDAVEVDRGRRPELAARGGGRRTILTRTCSGCWAATTCFCKAGTARCSCRTRAGTRRSGRSSAGPVRCCPASRSSAPGGPRRRARPSPCGSTCGTR